MKRPRRQRKNSSSLRLFILIFAITLGLVVLFSVVPTYTQIPTLRTNCTQKVQELAKSDVKNDISRRNEYAAKLYGKKCGLEDEKILQIYDDEYTQQLKVKKKNPWEQLKPGTGWSVAVLLFFALIFKDTLTKWFSQGIEAVGDQIYTRLSGTPLLYRYSLKRYREKLKENYEKLKISFRPNKPLNIRDIYVPLKVTGTNDSNLIDALIALKKYRILMVKGTPGSGKTMLLKYIALCYASDHQAKLFKEIQCVPILVELHRFSSNQELTVELQLVEALKRNGFPNSKRFISQSLENGKLLLLLDGLDEVSSDNRNTVVQKINDFLVENNKCHVIMTCRTAVYRNEFNDVVDQTLEVVEFNDQQIQEFLGSWKPDMPPGKSIEQLMQTLHDRPRIMALARNPLMLTIIAYLYTDTTFILPHSRATFYRKATEILLDQWHYERNNYDARDKNLILQNLALFFQDNANKKGQDRRSVDRKKVEEKIKEILPNLNKSPDCIKPILVEIIERSGLLLAIDGGERYQFAHLTLQEFFAASELQDKADDLISRFKTDPDAWRETLKLWCGIASDSTKLITEVRLEDPVVAFECLADVQKVDPILADEIINSFKSQLGSDNNSDIVNHAFASVAADDRRRTDVFTFLKETLENASETDARRKAAVNALSLTNLPSAAKVLVEQYKNIDEGELHQTLYQALIRMGNIAVAEIVKVVNDGSIQVMDTLVNINTLDALQVLVDCLWRENKEISLCAALLLASLLKNETFEKVLENCKIPPNNRKIEFDWIWQRFKNNDKNDDYQKIPVILGQIAYLITKQLFNPVSKVFKSLQISTLDIRILYPILFIESLEKVDFFSVDLSKFTGSYEKYLMRLFDKTSDKYDLWEWLITRNFSPFQIIFIQLVLKTFNPLAKLTNKKDTLKNFKKLWSLKSKKSNIIHLYNLIIETEENIEELIYNHENIEESKRNFIYKEFLEKMNKVEKEIIGDDEQDSKHINTIDLLDEKGIQAWQETSMNYSNARNSDVVNRIAKTIMQNWSREKVEISDLAKIETAWRKEKNMNKKLT